MKPIEKGLIYAIVPARSGSQGVKDKNILPLAGHPLLAYSIAAGKATPSISRVIVTTDSPQYAEIARRYGADVPFLRPAQISGSTSTDLEFMRHVIAWLDAHEDKLPEYWVHLRPTTPIREVSIIQDAIDRMAMDPAADSLRSAHRTPLCPFKWFWRGEDGYYHTFNGITLDEANGPRQKFPPMFVADGYVDVLKTSFIVENNLLYGEKMIAFEVSEAVDVDTREDLIEAGRKITSLNNAITDYLAKIE